jgi:hypothetical protein
MKEHGNSAVRIDSPVLLARSWVHRRFNTSDGCMGFGLLLFLSLPSLCLFISIPPLWRDSDGFYQVATKFEFLTVLHWPPLYCFCARIPFLAATILDGSFFHTGFSFQSPRITDLGVYLLLVSQHLLLIGTLLSVCVILTRSWLLRFLIAALFVSCAPIYVFAHCVGSEAIMAPLLLLGCAAGLRYLSSPSQPWLILLFCLISLNILDRHADAVIAGLVPLALLLLLGIALVRGHRLQRDRSYFQMTGRSLLITIGVGTAGILAANGIVRAVCRFDKIPYRSRAGYAFVWRLDFLKNLPVPRQTAILDKAESDLHDPAITVALEKVKEMSAKGDFVPDDACTAMDQALGDEGYQGQPRHVMLDQKLNRFFSYFLWHDPVDLSQAVSHDVVNGMSFTPSLLTKDPFLCTDWLVKRIPETRFHPIQNLQTLSTDSNPVKQYDTSPYFHFWSFLPFSAMAVGIVFTGLIGILTAKNGRDLALAVYAIACTLTGIASAVISFTVVTLLPRLMLPTLILLCFAVVVLLMRLDPLRYDHSKPAA